MNSHTASNILSRQKAAPSSDGPVISLTNVSVRYRVPQERIGTFKEYMIRWLQGKVKNREFWALNGISLEIQPGEIFGLIGQNGAGKSTLLKLISRVLRPTAGRLVVNGRVAPLLEVGAGFHAELTGRENIYLNGAMLGFSREEMAAKFERIVEFSELGEFIDAPLRTYSSGMWARLGFAVATDSQPEILIVDEILSVGDEAFQRKCFDRIQSFEAQGATILMVSHSMNTIETMCQRAAWLDHGKVVALGPARSVVARYLGRVKDHEAERLAEESAQSPAQRWGDRRLEIKQVRVLNAEGKEQHIFHTGESIVLQIDYFAHEPVVSPIVGIAIHKQDGTHITGPNTGFGGLDLGRVEGPNSISYTIPAVPLLEGLFHFSVAVVDREDSTVYDYHDRLYPFRIDNRGYQIPELYGLMTLQGKWEVV